MTLQLGKPPHCWIGMGTLTNHGKKTITSLDDSERLGEVQPPNGDWPLEHSDLPDLAASDEEEEKQQLVVVVAVGAGGGWRRGGHAVHVGRQGPRLPRSG